jgi:hypothetical protein
VAVGEMGPVLIHAAAFNESIKNIILLRSTLSYSSMVLNEFYKVSVASAVPGALTAYDLPDLMACISPRKIILSESTDHMLEPVSEEIIKQELAYPLSVYSLKNVPGNLMIVPHNVSPDSIINFYYK